MAVGTSPLSPVFSLLVAFLLSDCRREFFGDGLFDDGIDVGRRRWGGRWIPLWIVSETNAEAGRNSLEEKKEKGKC